MTTLTKLKLPWKALGILRKGSVASVCRIELILLIHNETGLLLKHAMRRGTNFADPDQIAGMLTALREFVTTAFDERENSVHQFRVADRIVYFEMGPRAMLAGVARAVAMPAHIELQFRETLRQIHLEFGQELNAFSGDVAPFERVAALLNPYVPNDDSPWWTRAWFKRRSA